MKLSILSKLQTKKFVALNFSLVEEIHFKVALFKFECCIASLRPFSKDSLVIKGVFPFSCKVFSVIFCIYIYSLFILAYFNNQVKILQVLI
jgi:hypothetical protein